MTNKWRQAVSKAGKQMEKVGEGKRKLEERDKDERKRAKKWIENR